MVVVRGLKGLAKKIDKGIKFGCFRIVLHESIEVVQRHWLLQTHLHSAACAVGRHIFFEGGGVHCHKSICLRATVTSNTWYHYQ